MPLSFMFTLLLALPMASPAVGPRIDLNQDTPRGDVVSTDRYNWRVAEGASSTFRAGPLTLELRAASPTSPLTTAWWKPGFDYPARMASDGVVSRGPVRLIVRGLSAGRHSLATWHNVLTVERPQPMAISNVAGATTTVTPSQRVTHDDRAAAAYVEFDTRAGEDVAIDFTPAADGQVVINGLEIDRPDPTRRALLPVPHDGDEHAPENPVLAWQPAASATAHHVYLGTNDQRVAAADPDAAEFRGECKEPTFATQLLRLDHRQPYYWRVDEVHPAGVVRGEVWRLAVRRLAFPQAEGYGRFARGGRGGRVLEVTNLNDSGVGSLRAAVETEGPRTVVFRVGGLIALKSKLVVRHPFLTIAGQTAPGDGICVKNYTFGCSDTHDVIFRHVRIRVGDESGTTQDGCGARGSDHVIFDHCSISWSIDEGFSSRQARNLTVQRCLIAEALHLAGHEKYVGTGKGHSFAGSISGDIGSFHHNLLAHCTGRNWSLAGGLDRTDTRLAGRLDIRNNVVFNWRDRTTDGGVRELCFVGNCYLPGPATRVFSLLKPDPGDAGRGMRAFLAGNRIEGQPQLDDDNWLAFVGSPADREKIRAAEPLWEPHVATQTTHDLVDNVLADVGATKPRQDAVDRRILADVRARKATFTGSRGKLPGILDSQADAGGWPEYASGTSPADSDDDGLPDDWEQDHDLNPRDPVDGALFRPDGYTHLEHYLNELAK